MTDKLIINAAINGMIPTHADTPHVPVTPDEIAEEVVRCYNAGASIFHIHARDAQGKPTHRLEVYRAIFKQIRVRCTDDIVLCVSTSGRMTPAFEARSESLDLEDDLKPSMASLTLGSLNFPQQASLNSPVGCSG